MADESTTQLDALAPAFASPPLDAAEEGRVLSSVLSSMFGDGDPERIDRYEIERRIGAGGLGVVWAARDPVLGRRVAIKTLHATITDPREQERLIREARALAQVRHPNVVTVHDVITDPAANCVYLVTELIEGVDLARWLEQPRPLGEVLRVFVEAGRGLAAAHAAGIVHRDFKPGNVMLADDGRVCVLDFGLAKGQGLVEDTARPSTGGTAGDDSDDALTAVGTVLGTPRYMAPEQHGGGTVDARSDQFAFCLSLWLAAYGVSPYRGAGEALAAQKHAEAIAAPTGRAPAWLGKVLRRGLAADPERRYGSMTELLARLAQRQRWRRRAPWAAVAAVATVAAIGVAATIDRGSPVPQAAAPVHHPEVDDALAAAWTRMNAKEFTAADAQLRRALSIDPGDGRVHLQLAMVMSWLEHPPREIHSERTLALASDDLSPAQVAFVEGFGHQVDDDYAAALAVYEPATARWPDDVLLQYGLFEGLFHGGRIDEVLAVHRRIRALDPAFTLHTQHVLDHCAAIDDVECVREGAADIVHWSGGASQIWESRLLMRAGRQADARAVLENWAPFDDAGYWVPAELLMQAMMAGELERVQRLGAKPMFLRLPALAVALLRGDEAAIGPAFDDAIAFVSQNTSTASGALRWIDLGAMLVPGRSHARLDAWKAGLADAAKDSSFHSDRLPALELHVLAALDRRDALTAHEASVPEAEPIIAGYTAGWRGDAAAAIAAWQRAVRSSPDSVLSGLAGLELARAHAQAGDARGVLAACTAVLLPLAPPWTWPATAGPCLALRAQAWSELRDRDRAREDATRLLALRSGAAPDDPLVSQARALLRALGE
ncbi:MAG: protein kinase [Nannocystaceae bacterium]|nr:protein kinase [Nannocystaceae bacterium]